MPGRLWRGEVALATVFWGWLVAGGIALNSITTLAAMTLFAGNAPTALAMTVYLLAVPYNLFIAVAVWRSAARYTGPRHWADLARIAGVAGAVLLSAA